MHSGVLRCFVAAHRDTPDYVMDCYAPLQYCMHRFLSSPRWHEVAAGVQGSDLQLDMHDANEPNILEPQHLPDTEALAEGFRGCLQVSHLYLSTAGLSLLCSNHAWHVCKQLKPLDLRISHEVSQASNSSHLPLYCYLLLLISLDLSGCCCLQT